MSSSQLNYDPLLMLQTVQQELADNDMVISLHMQSIPQFCAGVASCFESTLDFQFIENGLRLSSCPSETNSYTSFIIPFYQMQCIGLNIFSNLEEILTFEMQSTIIPNNVKQSLGILQSTLSNSIPSLHHDIVHLIGLPPHRKLSPSLFPDVCDTLNPLRGHATSALEKHFAPHPRLSLTPAGSTASSPPQSFSPQDIQHMQRLLSTRTHLTKDIPALTQLISLSSHFSAMFSVSATDFRNAISNSSVVTMYISFSNQYERIRVRLVSFDKSFLITELPLVTAPVKTSGTTRKSRTQTKQSKNLTRQQQQQYQLQQQQQHQQQAIGIFSEDEINMNRQRFPPILQPIPDIIQMFPPLSQQIYYEQLQQAYIDAKFSINISSSHLFPSSSSSSSSSVMSYNGSGNNSNQLLTANMTQTPQIQHKIVIPTPSTVGALALDSVLYDPPRLDQLFIKIRDNDPTGTEYFQHCRNATTVFPSGGTAEKYQFAKNSDFIPFPSDLFLELTTSQLDPFFKDVASKNNVSSLILSLKPQHSIDVANIHERTMRKPGLPTPIDPTSSSSTSSFPHESQRHSTGGSAGGSGGDNDFNHLSSLQFLTASELTLEAYGIAHTSQWGLRDEYFITELQNELNDLITRLDLPPQTTGFGTGLLYQSTPSLYHSPLHDNASLISIRLRYLQEQQHFIQQQQIQAQQQQQSQPEESDHHRHHEKQEQLQHEQQQQQHNTTSHHQLIDSHIQYDIEFHARGRSKMYPKTDETSLPVAVVVKNNCINTSHHFFPAYRYLLQHLSLLHCIPSLRFCAIPPTEQRLLFNASIILPSSSTTIGGSSGSTISRPPPPLLQIPLSITQTEHYIPHFMKMFHAEIPINYLKLSRACEMATIATRWFGTPYIVALIVSPFRQLVSLAVRPARCAAAITTNIAARAAGPSGLRVGPPVSVHPPVSSAAMTTLGGSSSDNTTGIADLKPDINNTSPSPSTSTPSSNDQLHATTIAMQDSFKTHRLHFADGVIWSHRSQYTPTISSSLSSSPETNGNEIINALKHFATMFAKMIYRKSSDIHYTCDISSVCNISLSSDQLHHKDKLILLLQTFALDLKSRRILLKRAFQSLPLTYQTILHNGIPSFDPTINWEKNIHRTRQNILELISQHQLSNDDLSQRHESYTCHMPSINMIGWLQPPLDLVLIELLLDDIFLQEYQSVTCLNYFISTFHRQQYVMLLLLVQHQQQQQQQQQHNQLQQHQQSAAATGGSIMTIQTLFETLKHLSFASMQELLELNPHFLFYHILTTIAPTSQAICPSWYASYLTQHAARFQPPHVALPSASPGANQLIVSSQHPQDEKSQITTATTASTTPQQSQTQTQKLTSQQQQQPAISTSATHRETIPITSQQADVKGTTAVSVKLQSPSPILVAQEGEGDVHDTDEGGFPNLLDLTLKPSDTMLGQQVTESSLTTNQSSSLRNDSHQTNGHNGVTTQQQHLSQSKEETLESANNSTTFSGTIIPTPVNENISHGLMTTKHTATDSSTTQPISSTQDNDIAMNPDLASELQQQQQQQQQQQHSFLFHDINDQLASTSIHNNSTMDPQQFISSPQYDQSVTLTAQQQQQQREQEQEQAAAQEQAAQDENIAPTDHELQDGGQQEQKQQQTQQQTQQRHHQPRQLIISYNAQYNPDGNVVIENDLFDNIDSIDDNDDSLDNDNGDDMYSYYGTYDHQSTTFSAGNDGAGSYWHTNVKTQHSRFKMQISDDYHSQSGMLTQQHTMFGHSGVDTGMFLVDIDADDEEAEFDDATLY